MQDFNRRQLFATGASWLAAASGSELRVQSRPPRQGGHLRLGTRHDPSGLDAHRFPQGLTPAPIAAIYSGLTGIDKTGDVTTDLAQQYESSPSLKTWTFRLRRGLLFHNGREVDARSVRQNILRLKSIRTGIDWSSGVDHIESINILDKHTVRCNLSVPDASLPAGMMHGLQAPDAFSRANHHPIGTGPFKLATWKRHDETQLVRFANYWETDAEGTALPYLDTITGHYKPEHESRYAALQSGAVDIVDALTPVQAASLAPTSGDRFHLWRVHSGGIWLSFNWREGPFGDRRLRLAAAHAIDRETLHRAVFSAQGAIVNQPYPPGNHWHIANAPGLTYDPGQSKSLLQQARAIGTEVVMISGMGQSQTRQCTELIQQMWNEVGFKVRIEPLFGGQRQKRLRAGAFHAYVQQHPYHADPDAFYRRSFHSKSPDSRRLSGWYNPRFDQLTERAQASRDRARRHALYAEARQIIAHELSSFPLHDVTATLAAVKAFEGFAPGEVSSLIYRGGGLHRGYFAA